MREILAYIWSTDFFRARGDVAAGREIFKSRRGTCHGSAAIKAPDLKASNQCYYTAITMVWALWTHGQKMLQETQRQEQK